MEPGLPRVWRAGRGRLPCVDARLCWLVLKQGFAAMPIVVWVWRYN